MLFATLHGIYLLPKREADAKGGMRLPGEEVGGKVVNFIF
jgi:hypothetical protein